MKSNPVKQLQSALLDMPQAETPTRHLFCDGIYARELTIPKGVCLVGAKHKTTFFMVLSKGSCLIVDGDNQMEMSAPDIVVSEKGAKRCIYALEETILTTFHKTDKTNPEDIGRDIVEDEGLKIQNNGGLLLEVVA